MKYIETFREGEKIGDIYLCKHRTSAVTKNGKPYETILLQDRTGQIEGKIWDPHSMGIDEFEPLDYVDVMAEVVNFNGTLQLNVRRVRKASEGEYNMADYLPATEKNADDMYKALTSVIETVQNTYLRTLLEYFFIRDSGFAEEFKKHSAAKSVHHSFIGGLLEHTLSVTRLCDYYAKAYPVIQRDLLLTAAMLHDMGKIREISSFPVNDYTDDGQLLGHIVMGVEMIGEAIKEIEGFPPRLASQLKHCILAHHGEYEYGSPKKPALVEALALNLADNTDAKMQTMGELLKSNRQTADTDVWIGYNRLFESNIRRTTME